MTRLSRTALSIFTILAGLCFLSNRACADEKTEAVFVGVSVMAADYVSTNVGLSQGRAEVGPIARHSRVGAALILGTSLGTADYIIAKKAPKLKWPYRITIAAGAVLLARNNARKR